MKQLLVIAVLALAAFTACTDAYGQDTQAQVSKPTTVEALTNELCWCFSAIDLKQSDAAIDARVKRCMEDAIVHNPVAVRTLIQYTPKQNTVGFDLGSTLGSDSWMGVAPHTLGLKSACVPAVRMLLFATPRVEALFLGGRR